MKSIEGRKESLFVTSEQLKQQKKNWSGLAVIRKSKLQWQQSMEMHNIKEFQEQPVTGSR